MLPLLKKTILLSILFIGLTSCASKVDGKYHTKYSYHPYYNLYTKNMSNSPTTIRKKSPKAQKEKSKISLNQNNRFPH